jgi:hypothetical protein
MIGAMAESLSVPLAKDVGEWFSAVGAKHTCPICENLEWTLVGTVEEGVVGAALPALQSTGNTAQRHFRLIILTCTRCSFVRQHLYNEFRAWYLKNKAQGIPTQ